MEIVEEYYNSKDWIKEKINEFINGNQRVDECISFFERSVDSNIRNIAEIGCSIGLTTFVLASKFPMCKFTGFDIAEEQIKAAQKFLGKENIKYAHADITNLESHKEKFDCITLFDVYEHVPQNKREEFNIALKSLLNKNGILLITCPSWIISTYKNQYEKETRQVVDEIVYISDYEKIAEDIGGQVVYLELKSIWQSLDYCHCIISTEKALTTIDKRLGKTRLIKKIAIKMGLGSLFQNTNYARKKKLKSKISTI